MPIIAIVINKSNNDTSTTNRLSARSLETHMTKTNGKIAIVTGASSGGGEVTADDRIIHNHSVTWKNVPTRTIDVAGVPFAYRELGPKSGVPVIFLHHLMAVLDDWDPRVIDGIAAHRHVITFDNRGVGASGGLAEQSTAAIALRWRLRGPRSRRLAQTRLAFVSRPTASSTAWVHSLISLSSIRHW